MLRGLSIRDGVIFADGDVTSPIAAALPTLSQWIGLGAPMLDVTYEMPVAVEDPEAVEAPTPLLGGPNPFAGSITLRFALPRPGATQLSIYDVAGRRLVTLVEGPMPAGPHRIVWDGRAGGRLAPAGVYWARLLWDRRMRCERLVRVQQ